MRNLTAQVSFSFFYPQIKLSDRTPSQSTGLNLLGSKAYGLLRDLVVENTGALESVRKNEKSRSFLVPKANNSSGEELNISLELQKRGFRCLYSAMETESSENVRYYRQMCF